MSGGLLCQSSCSLYKHKHFSIFTWINLQHSDKLDIYFPSALQLLSHFVIVSFCMNSFLYQGNIKAGIIAWKSLGNLCPSSRPNFLIDKSIRSQLLPCWYCSSL